MPRSVTFCLAEFDKVAIGISQEAADLPAPVMRRGEKGRASCPQRLVGRLAVSDPQRERVTDLIRVRGRREDNPWLAGVGPPPLTSSSQVPAKRSTTLVPPYSR